MAESDHKVLIAYSTDGGRNWSNWKERDLGAIGQYMKRIRVNRINRGNARNGGRQFVVRIRVSSARKHDLMGAVVKAEAGAD